MEQAELILLIGRLTDRVLLVETDVTALKTHQKEHECQIETLAFEVHQLGEKVDTLEKSMNRRFKHTDSKIDTLSTDLKLVLEALAIKY